MENENKELETDIAENNSDAIQEENKVIIEDIESEKELVAGNKESEGIVKKKMPRWKKVVLTFLAVILGIAVILVAVFFIMRATGKESLLSRTNNQKVNEERLAEKSEEGVVGIDLEAYDDEENDDVQNGNSDETDAETGKPSSTINKYIGIASTKDISKINSSIQKKIQQLEVDTEDLSEQSNYTNEEIKETLQNIVNKQKEKNESTENSTNDNTSNNTDSNTNDNNENSEKETSSADDTDKEEGSASEDDKIIVSDSEEYDLIYKNEKYKYNDDMINILLLGIDKYHEVRPAANGRDGGQSDVILLLAMNPHTKIIDIIAVPRDTIARISIYNVDGTYDHDGYAQICLQHGYGDAMSVSNERAKNAISYLFYNLPINTVSSMNIAGIGALNDSIGGVTLDALQDFTYNGVEYKEGQTVELLGDLAMNYVLFRDCTRHYTALERLARQKQYLYKFVDKMFAAIKNDPTIVTEIYGILSQYVVTDLSTSEMVYLATEAVGYSFGDIKVLEGTVDTSWKYERYYLDEEAFKDLLIDEFYEKVN